MSDQTPERRRLVAWPVVALALLSLPIIFYRLGSYSLVNGDEGFYHYVARHMLETGNWFRLEFTGEHRVYDTFMNAPIHYWVKAVLIAAFGDSYWTMRILSAAFGLGTVLMTYRLTAYLAGRWAAFVAGLLQLTTVQFIHLHGARTGEMETIIAFLYVAAAYLFLRALHTGRSFVPHFICLALLSNLKLPLVIVPLVADLVFLGVTPAARRRLRSWALAGLLILPLPLAWHIGQAIALGDQFWQTISTMLQQATGEKGLAGPPPIGMAGNAWFYARVILFGAFPAAVVYPIAIVGVLSSKENLRQPCGRRLLVLYGAAVIAYFIVVSKHYPWYIIPAYPFLSALVAIWLERLRRSTPNLTAILAVALILALLLWIRVEIRSFNPFSTRALAVRSFAAWRDLLRFPLWFGLPATIAFFAGLLHMGRLLLPARWAGIIGYALAAILISFASLRTLYPLRYTGHQTGMALLRQELSATEAAGKPLSYPIPVHELGILKVRYYFGDDFDITLAPRSSGAVYHLHQRGKTGDR